jgi:hypothetical protein
MDAWTICAIRFGISAALISLFVVATRLIFLLSPVTAWVRLGPAGEHIYGTVPDWVLIPR